MEHNNPYLYLRDEQDPLQMIPPASDKTNFQRKDVPSPPPAPPPSFYGQDDREEEEREREHHHQEDQDEGHKKGSKQEKKGGKLKQEGREDQSIKTSKQHGAESKSEGKEEIKKDRMSVLQKHCEFFDRNKDGWIYPWETFQGLRAIGFGIILSCIGVLLIHCAFFFFATRSWIPSLRLGLDLKMVHKLKHGSDAEVYDHDGRMDKEKLDEMFSRYSNRSDAIHVRNVLKMTQDKWEALDFFGWCAAKLEWGFFAVLVADKNGWISREDIEGQYDGSLFYKLEERNKSKRSKQKAH